MVVLLQMGEANVSAVTFLGMGNADGHGFLLLQFPAMPVSDSLTH